MIKDEKQKRPLKPGAAGRPARPGPGAAAAAGAKPTEAAGAKPAETAGAKPTEAAEAKAAEALLQAQHEAAVARELLIPGALASIIGQEIVSSRAVRIYMNGYRRDAGYPTDPVEQILLQQLLIAHHRVAQLQVRAEKAESPEHIKILNSSASRLLAEVRRLALAIRLYRTPVSPRSFSVVHQQNVVAGDAGRQEVTYVDQSTADRDKVSLSARSELEADTPGQGKEGVYGGRFAEQAQGPP